MTTYQIEVLNDKDELALMASRTIRSVMDLALTSQRERIQIALSGGSTPCKTYLLLGNEQFPWNRVDVFLGDERWVDPSNDLSNTKMLYQSLFISEPASKASFYPIPTTNNTSPQESAKEFSSLMERICRGKPPVFDLVLLGLGDDGHTASLFPGTAALDVCETSATVASGNGLDRITMTHPVLSAAKKVVFLVSGTSKNIALKRLLDPSEPYSRTPAKLVRPDSEILILADKDAANPI